MHSAAVKEQQQINLALLNQIQKNQEQIAKYNETLEQHAQALLNISERTEAIHQNSLEQQKAYQAGYNQTGVAS